MAEAASEQVASRQERRTVMVIGVGNALRRDDAAGLQIAQRVRARADRADLSVRELEGEPLSLLEMWAGADAVVLVDAIRSGGRPGTIHRLDASRQPLPAALRSSSSTHALGISEAIELARALRRLPRRVLVFGVEGRRFDAGTELSHELEAALDGLADEVLGAARALVA